MTALHFVFGISLLSIVLGFVALLSQRIYLDKTTNKPVEIEVPVLGKMKSNYPALLFVFLGFALAFYAFDKSYPPAKVEWVVTGALKSADGGGIDWDKGSLTLFPLDVETEISKNGKFKIAAKLPQGVKFEEIIQRIDYTHEAGSVQFLPGEELKKFAENPSSSLIENRTAQSIRFKPVAVETF